MGQYILNLTNNLIGKNHYKKLFNRVIQEEEDKGNEHIKFTFITFVKRDLVCDDVRKMTPETLGRIMCAFNIGQSIASRQEVLDNVHFFGDCEEMLRELVSSCLALAIWHRLNVKETPKQ